jgi:SOS-response transcriptional repressor LexA
MNWESYIEDLRAGKTVQMRPKGNSMTPIIGSGDLITIEPKKSGCIKKGDIVFCKVNGKYYVHLVQAVTQKMGGCRYQIGNNHNNTNGTIGINNIFGKVVEVERK